MELAIGGAGHDRLRRADDRRDRQQAHRGGRRAAYACVHDVRADAARRRSELGGLATILSGVTTCAGSLELPSADRSSLSSARRRRARPPSAARVAPRPKRTWRRCTHRDRRDVALVLHAAVASERREHRVHRRAADVYAISVRLGSPRSQAQSACPRSARARPRRHDPPAPCACAVRAARRCRR